MSSPGATVSVFCTEKPQAISCTTFPLQVLVPASHVPPAAAQSVVRLASAMFTPSTIAVKFAFSAFASSPFVNVYGTVTSWASAKSAAPTKHARTINPSVARERSP